MSKSDVLTWPVVRMAIGEVIGLDEYRARCQVIWSCSFARIDADVAPDDLLVIAQRVSLLVGFEVSVPRLGQTVGEWFEEIAAAI